VGSGGGDYVWLESSPPPSGAGLTAINDFDDYWLALQTTNTEDPGSIPGHSLGFF
jgi:hypothetical protein